ncbi:MAG: hypothetical protein NVS1B13_03440 [Flavisolibacter sp.]
MKLSEFILLNENEMKHTVLHRGILIAKRSSYNYLVFLFQLENYYIETFCNRDNQEIEEYRVFDNTKALNPYIENIALEGLFN